AEKRRREVFIPFFGIHAGRSGGPFSCREESARLWLWGRTPAGMSYPFGGQLMLRILWKMAKKRLSRRRPARKSLWEGRFVPSFEPLADRITPAITASFVPNSGILTVFGDALDNTITLSRNAAGNLFVNGGAVPIQGGAATVANTSLLQVFGLGGNDKIALDE